MQRFIVTCVVSGLIAGLLVGGFDNLFTVPVIERAIALEEERSAGDPPPTAEELAAETPVSLGVQRIGMAAGDGIRGAIFGLIFAAGYTLLRRAAPHWQPLAVAVVAGALGFWAISLFPFIKYPFNPPGVGDEGTLLFRQGFQYLVFLLSAAGIAGLLIGVHRINLAAIETNRRLQLYGMLLLGYGVLALVILLAIPGNPDPVPVPIDLLELFRTLTMIGHFLSWALLVGGVTLALKWQDRSQKAGDGRVSSTAGRDSGR